MLASLLIWAGMMALARGALSQTAIAGAGSSSSSVAGAGAQSGSAAIINQTWNAPNRVDQTLTYAGRYSSTIRNTPDAHGPVITGGANPCIVGASAGGAVAGFGISLGATFNDRGCERRNLAVLAHQMGRPELAQEILCGAQEVREARARLGTPCLGDQVPPAVMNAAPVVLAATQPTQSTEVRRARERPAFCDTLSNAEERRRYSRQCG
jgi:hypothetical protein